MREPDKNLQDAYADGRPTITLEKDTGDTHSMRFHGDEPWEIRLYRGAEHIRLENLRDPPGERRWLVALLLACIIVLATALAFAASALLEAP